VDGSGWQGVYDLLIADGFNVSVVQNQTLSLQSDVETTRNVLDLQDGPAILVGHSYGGVVITEAGRHERVAGLVYITAFAPDTGESVNALIANPPPGAPVPPILPPRDGFLFLDREQFAASFAADLPASESAFMADSQVPWGVEALEGAVSQPAWRTKPSWYLVATDDRMIPPPAQRAMSERAGLPARPLLRVWRADVTAYCTALGLATLDDPSNADPRFLRSRVRHELLPALEVVFPAARRRLCALAERQRRLIDPD